MAVVTSTEMAERMQAETDRQLATLLADMHHAADAEPTFHGKALRSIAYLRSQPRLKRFLLLDLVRDSPASPDTVATDAGNKGRPAIAPSKPESGSTLTTS
jgi:Ser/Thr protein kinase RdoA (MazF antagonist)